MFDDDLRDLYQEVILDHGRNPRNFHRPAGTNYQASGHNPLCGDRLTLHLAVSPEGLISDAGFEGKGCAISQASASLMTDIVKGKTVAQAEKLFEVFHRLCTQGDVLDEKVADEDVRDRLTILAGVRHFPMRVKCATLAWHALHAALNDESSVSTE